MSADDAQATRLGDSNEAFIAAASVVLPTL
jgi:hypothetical protein